MAEDFTLTPSIMLNAYANGIFPMADSADDEELFWVDPKTRGVFPLERFYLSRSTRTYMRKKNVTARVNNDFSGIVNHCANRCETWINPALKDLYDQLHQMGYAHSVEVFEDDRLIGGVFGLTIGAAFFGESMVSIGTNGSKMALAFLVDRLKLSGFSLFDTQFITDHLASLGAVEISRASYRSQLANAVEREVDFTSGPIASSYDVLQRMTQTS